MSSRPWMRPSSPHVPCSAMITTSTGPALFDIARPPTALTVISALLLGAGLIIWIWSVVLILVKAPRGELITTGPYALMKHPIYTSVALLVLPWLGCLLHSWLGALIGGVVYLGSRLFSPAEEAALSKTFGAAWDAYCAQVKWPWL